MSFVGDTMVWPFSIIVPVVMLFTFLSVEKSKKLFDCVFLKVNPAWFNSVGAYGKDHVLQKTQAILNYDNGKMSTFFKWAPVLIICAFWGYNSLTCGFAGQIGSSLYPYKTNKIFVVETFNDAPSQTKTITLPDKVLLPKWDCDFSRRPISTILTRFWTLVFYGIPPFLLFKLINVLWAVTYFLGCIKKWEKESAFPSNETALRLEPYSRDNLGGLSPLPEAGMAYFYNVSAFSLLLVMSFLKEGADPSWHNYLILILFIPILFYALLFPALSVRQSILSSKERFLDLVSKRAMKTFSDAIDKEKTDDEVPGEYYEKINALDSIYDKIDSIPEWPFSYSSGIKILFSFSVPVLILIGEALFGSFIEKLLGL